MLDVQSLVKYLVEGLAVAAAAYYIPKKTANVQEILMIAVTAGAVFAILDQFTPAVSAGARHGAGFGIGYNITNGLEGFEGSGPDDYMDPDMVDIEDEEEEMMMMDTESEDSDDLSALASSGANSGNAPGNIDGFDDMDSDDDLEAFSSVM